MVGEYSGKESPLFELLHKKPGFLRKTTYCSSWKDSLGTRDED